MRYLIVDGELSGSGIRDKYESGYIEVETLKLSFELANKISQWQMKYEKAHKRGFNLKEIDSLDIEGVALAKAVKEELGDVKVEYFSAGKMINILL